MSNVWKRPGQKSDYLITNRRKEEDARASMLVATQYYAKMNLNSQFEHSTSTRLEHKDVLRRYKMLEGIETDKLEHRRNLLRDLIESDNERYRTALLNQEESNEARINAMRKRMTELRDIRLKERQAVVEAKLEQQWRY